jgi:hypothetical protein
MASRKSVLNERLALVQAAIAGTLTRGVRSYSTEIQSLTAMSLAELRSEERAILNELARLNRGTRFGNIGFTRVS